LTPSRASGDPKDAAALTILAEVLGGGATARLTKALEKEAGSAVSTAAWYSGLSLDQSEFGLYAAPAEGATLESVEAQLDAELATLAQDGPTEDELARARAGVTAAEIYAQDSQAGLARRYGAALAIGLSIEDVQAWPDLLRAVSAEDVKRAASLLRPEASVTGWLMGEGSAVADPDEVSAERIDG
jgi:zinc protease